MDKEVPRVAVNIFVIRDGKILLGKRRGKLGGGYWGLPGGKLEFYESLVDCAKKELREETGLTCDKMTFLHLINDPCPTTDESHWIHIEFLAENAIGEPELKEPEKCSGWEWFDLSNLPKDIFLGHRKSIPTFLGKTAIL